MGGFCLYILETKNKTWKTLSLKTPYECWQAGCVFLNEEVYVVGGWAKDGEVAFLQKLGNDLKWNKLADMHVKRQYISNSCVAFDDCLWVLGGYNKTLGQLNSVEKYNPLNGKWILMPFVNFSAA